MASAQFTSYLGQVKKGMEQQAAQALEVIGGMAETYAKLLCPVDTGRLRNSITHQMQGNTAVIIGTNVEYAPYVELGTRRMKAQPYIKPAVEEHADDYKRILQQYLSE